MGFGDGFLVNLWCFWIYIDIEATKYNNTRVCYILKFTGMLVQKYGSERAQSENRGRKPMVREL